MKIEIYTDKIYYEGEETEDPEEVAKRIKGCISHLGDFKIYYNSNPKNKKWWQRLLYYTRSGV